MKINKNCVGCGACLSVCPVEAIQEGPIYSINKETCIECGACESACPNEAITNE